ncbi:hypothetical protein [Dysgonomonas massiliensis]|nr:hypothetical protein [Dysgonomonas massiliensis]
MTAKKNVSGNNNIDAMFYIFKEGNYDPTTLSRENHLAYEATLKNDKGEIVKSIAFGSTNSNKSYVIYECKVGKYYVVCCPSGFKPNTIVLMNLWKAKEVEVTKQNNVAFEAKFSNLYNTGYVEWDE